MELYKFDITQLCYDIMYLIVYYTQVLIDRDLTITYTCSHDDSKTQHLVAIVIPNIMIGDSIII